MPALLTHFVFGVQMANEVLQNLGGTQRVSAGKSRF